MTALTLTHDTIQIEAAMNTTIMKLISVQDWDRLVSETYGRIYSFQQQDGCRDRGTLCFTVPDTAEDYDRDSLPDIVNYKHMGVSFAAWLARDPEEWHDEDGKALHHSLWWERNFYPNLQMIANDLHARGLLDDGKYMIQIDW